MKRVRTFKSFLCICSSAYALTGPLQQFVPGERCHPESSFLSVSAKDDLDVPSPNNGDGSILDSWSSFPALESPMYNEERPRRIDAHRQFARQKDQHKKDEWGIERHDPAPVNFPGTLDALTDEVFHAIAATLYDQQKPDPNVVQNAFQGDKLHGRRPVRNTWDAGRIGVEIDNARYLFSRSKVLDHASRKTEAVANAVAVRLVALNLAEKLTRSPWTGYENGDDSTSTRRPVVLYFNRIKQALAASDSLLALKRRAKHFGDNAAYENITIRSLCDGPVIPEEMTHKTENTPSVKPSSKRSILESGHVDPTKGIILVVQPTDFNEEYRPPGPAVGALESLQKLAARASVEEIPVVCISPRFLTTDDPSATSCQVAAWDQSGYQQSATYGGLEPPRGPTPWVLRDFSPPVFCWVGNALPMQHSHTRSTASSSHHKEEEDSQSDLSMYYYYSGISLVQSVRCTGHRWHVFASKEQVRPSSSSQLPEYQYLASTKNAAGRPTREVVKRLFEEFTPQSE